MNIRLTIVQITVGLLLFASACWLAACEKEEDGIPPDNMSITRFEPVAGLAGDTIVIVGKGFDPQFVKNVVQFNASRKTAEVLSADASGTRLEVIVPEDAQAGNVKVATGPYSTLSNLPFLFAPSIGSVNPQGALPGEQILVSGKNFTTNLSNLLIYIGDTEIDSIFGGSSTQIIFPLPEGLPVGNTTIRVGTRLTASDSVLSPPFAFNVFDPLQPTLINLDPNLGTPGARVTINGNAFNVTAGKTKVTFGTYTILSGDFETISPSKIVFRVPADYPIDGKAQEIVEVSVTVTTAGGDLNSSSLSFTVIEPSNIEFYYTAINLPGTSGSQRQDDSLYRATPIVGGSIGAAVKERKVKTFLGMDIDLASNTLFYSTGSDLKILNLTTGVEQTKGEGVIFIISDLSYSPSNNRVYYPVREDGFFSYNLTTDVQSSNISPFQEILNVKNDNTDVYWIGKGIFSNENTIRKTNKANGTTQTLFSVLNPEVTKIWVALAVGSSKLYYVEGPTNPAFLTNTNGTSTIYEVNKDGTGTPSALYTFTNTVITDIELSKDGSKLFLMVSGESGAIESVPVISDLSQRKVEVSNIRNGRYLEVFERD